MFVRGNLRNSNCNINLKINNHNIQQVDSVKYLGLWLDKKLKWGKHINTLQQKTLKSLNIFKTLAGSSWGIHPKHLRRLYLSIIRSKLDYCCYLYDNSAKSHLAKIEKVQNQALRVIGGFIRSTPVHVMQSELCIEPLFIRRKYLASKFYLKSRSFSNNLTLKELEKLNSLCENVYWRRKKLPLLVDVHRQYCDHPIQSYITLQMFLLNKWLSSFDISRNIKLNIDNMEKSKRNFNALNLRNICNNYINKNFNSFYKLYTDGSKDVNGCGAAFFDAQADIRGQFKISADISIMHCELIGISEALSYIESIDKNKFIVFTDTKSALYHLARLPSILRGHPIAFDILDSICKIRESGKELVIHWIPSHVDIAGNEEADKAARQAITTGIVYELKPLYNELMREVKVNCRQIWHEYFDERSRFNGIWYKTLQSQPPRYPWFDSLRLDRKSIVSMLRLCSGHIPSNKFKYLMKMSSTPNCQECNVIEDVYHLLMECVRNEVQRGELQYMHGHGVGVCNSILGSPLSKESRMLLKIYLISIT